MLYKPQLERPSLFLNHLGPLIVVTAVTVVVTVLSPVTTVMYRPSTVFMLLVAVTFSLSLALAVYVCPIAVDVSCVDFISDLVALRRAISAHARQVLPVTFQTLNVGRLTRICDDLSALAAGSHVQLIIVESSNCFRQFIILSRPVGHFLICTVFLVWLLVERITEVLFRCTFPYLHCFCLTLRIISVGCVYIMLCGAPILVFYCVVLDANPNLKPKQEPDLEISYAIVRRRKLPRMLQERYDREREQALQREAERRKTRLATPPLKTDPSETGPAKAPPAESYSHHLAKQGDAEPADPVPLVSTSRTEPCDITTSPSPSSSVSSLPSLITYSESAVSLTPIDPSTPASSACTPADSPATPDTEYHEDSSQAEGAALPLSGESEEKSELNASRITGGSDTPDLNPATFIPFYPENLDTPSVAQHEVIAANDTPIISACPTSSPIIIESEANEVSQSGTKNSVEKHMDPLDTSDTTVQDILATPGMAALIEAAVAELASSLANDIANPPVSETNQISTNQDAACTESTPSTAGSHTIQADSNCDARLLENDSAGRSDTAITTCLAQDATAPPSMDVYMTTEQVDEVLELLDAELARTDGDPAGLDLDLSPGASESTDMTLAPPPIPSTPIPTVDADLQALDAMWESMGINPTEPEHMDIDLGAMELDSTVSTTETGASGTGMHLEHNVCAHGEPVAVPPTDNTVLNGTGSAMDPGMEMSDEECLAALAQLCEAIGAIVGDMDLDETRAAMIATPSEQQTMVQQPDSSTFNAPDDSECDVSMSDEECITQLAELCKDITPATNPEADLEQTLAMLSRLAGNTTGGTVAQDVAGPTHDLAPPRTEAGPSGCMRLEDVIDCAMVVDTVGEVDTSESEDESEYLATPTIGPMEVDETLAKTGWRYVEMWEQDTMCPLNMHNDFGVRDSPK